MEKETKGWEERLIEMIDKAREQNWSTGGNHVYDYPEIVVEFKVLVSQEIQSALKEKENEWVEKGRLSVLQDFDNMCKADAFIGFSDEEWKAIKKFFEFNKQVSGWDKN